MFTRQEIEKREEEFLASYAAKSSRSLGRRYSEEEHPYRTAFQRDRDRIIHSTAFRRLEYKTQVFVNHEGDYYRTRLTHTIEVAQIARTIARALNINEDLTEALALGHDLGHTPFGHSGEEALKEVMQNNGGFEHNIQGLRVIELLENRYPKFRGLNLSWEVRESMYKHTEKKAKNSGLPTKPSEYKPKWQPLLECQVVDIADSIAYDAHDVDDGIKSGLIKETDLEDIKLWQRAKDLIQKKYPGIRGSMMARQIVLQIINLEVSDLVENTERNLKKMKICSIDNVRNTESRIAAFSTDMNKEENALQKFLFDNLYRHHKVIRMAEKARRFLLELFEAYVSNLKQIPLFFQEWASEVGKHRAVCDYIAGMTDRFAEEEYKKLFFPFEKV